MDLSFVFQTQQNLESDIEAVEQEEPDEQFVRGDETPPDPRRQIAPTAFPQEPENWENIEEVVSVQELEMDPDEQNVKGNISVKLNF